MLVRNALLSREKEAHRAQMIASIGRVLRDAYDTAQPLPDRLASLVRQIAEPIDDSQKKTPPRGGGSQSSQTWAV
jgi:hypothetical protein